MKKCIKKICNKCKIEKEISSFGILQKSFDGYRHSCKDCRTKNDKEYRIRNKKEINERQRYKYKISNNFTSKENKKCSICNLEKSINYFPKEKSSKDGLKSYCKECKSKIGKNYYIKNKNKINDRNKNYFSKNKKTIDLYYKKYSKENKERINKRLRDRRLSNIQIRIKANIRGSLVQRLKNRSIKKINKTMDLLGYSIFDLIKRLESTFKDGMSWNNYGCGEGKWVIDHVTPDSWFRYDSVDHPDFKKSWALENLQALWWNENLKKGAKYAG